MAGNITNELVGKLGMKNLSKGVKVDVTEEHVSVDLSLNIRYGYNIPAVSEQVQEKVTVSYTHLVKRNTGYYPADGVIYKNTAGVSGHALKNDRRYLCCRICLRHM